MSWIFSEPFQLFRFSWDLLTWLSVAACCSSCGALTEHQKAVNILDPHTAIQLLPRALGSTACLGIKVILLLVKPECGEGPFPPRKAAQLV